MLQIAICDDECFYREKIQKLLVAYLESHQLTYNICFFTSGEEFLSQNENHVKYHIVFMDISMNELSGIETAMRMRAFHSDTFLVFVTAFIDYALEGYKANAIRYIMKDTLDAAVGECMDAILQKMRIAQVVFPFTEGERKLYTDNILYIESSKHKSIFHCMETDLTHYQIYTKLDAIERTLSDYGFLRIHKSYLVNMKHICKINHYIAYLDIGLELPIPRSRFRTAKETYVTYKGAL
ncbi:LytR/AlgR family response regulator transcription factor [Parablautia muri]|uniref:Stage 0 sporulation protein A homolog n=1 Tax=Parablautia muri TaxID=2320879 RepID=A0A9X5BI92_9FIRM|nr:LytTR family DNA-binding domain-containing protein [Parablautia muri]NBJ94112.1 DNA-binding response regulator [Parablautia muri]